MWLKIRLRAEEAKVQEEEDEVDISLDAGDRDVQVELVDVDMSPIGDVVINMGGRNLSTVGSLDPPQASYVCGKRGHLAPDYPRQAIFLEEHFLIR